MARLVDVDELIEYFDGDLEGYDNREYILHMLDSKGRSARVDAIPVEWVNQWVEDHTKYWQAVSRNGEPIPMRDTPYQVEELLEDWEKENEA